MDNHLIDSADKFLIDIYEIIDSDKDNINDLYKINIDQLFNTKPDYLIKNYIYSLCNYSNEKCSSYKFAYYTPLYDLSVNMILKYNKTIGTNKINFEINDIFIKRLSSNNKGKYFLEKIEKYLICNSFDQYIDILKKTTSYGTLSTFLFWGSYSISKEINIIELLNLAIINPDDRIFKYILEIENNIYSNELISKSVQSLCSSVIPHKHILRRLKLLLKYVNICYSYFDNEVRDFKLLYDITKYYYKSNDIIIFQKLYNILIFHYDYEICKKFYNLLNTNKEKNFLTLLLKLFEIPKNENEYNDFKFIGSFNNIIDEQYQYLLRFSSLFSNPPINDTVKQVFKYITDNKLINKHYEMHWYNLDYLIFSRFYVHDENKLYSISFNFAIMRINKVLHYLRIYAKKFKKRKINKFKIKFNPIINELENYKPNIKINILSKGSLNYQLNLQAFNRSLPKYLLPNELSKYKECLIEQKIDGLYINILPTNIFPIELNYEIQANYIEDLNLYLIFDINIKNKTVIERYNILRSMHPYTRNTKLETISNLGEFKEAINKENIILKNFINENVEIKWYPKLACLTFVDNIVNCDGLILTTLIDNKKIKT